MPLTQRHRHQILRIAADALDLVECGAGADEGERAALQLFQLLPPEGQTEPVHRHHVQAHIFNFKQRAGVHRAALVGGNRKGHLLDHPPQHTLLHGHRVFVLHLRQLRVIRGGKAENIKIRVAAGNVDHHFLVGGKCDHIIRHPADNITEQTGIEHNVAALYHVGEHVGADAGLHIVAGDGQLLVGVNQQSLQRGNGAFLGHGAAGNGDGILQEYLFTGKFDHRDRFLSVCNFGCPPLSDGVPGNPPTQNRDRENRRCGPP